MNRLLVLIVALVAVACAPGLPGDPHQTFCLEGFEVSPEHAEAVLDAADEWHDATAGRVSFSFVMGACGADGVPLRLVPGLVNPDDGVRSDGVTQGDGDFIALDPAAHAFRAVALHELGHWLTGAEHSDDARDIMAASDSPERAEHLTARDVARF